MYVNIKLLELKEWQKKNITHDKKLFKVIYIVNLYCHIDCVSKWTKIKLWVIKSCT